jgi:hypothetical protein
MKRKPRRTQEKSNVGTNQPTPTTIRIVVADPEQPAKIVQVAPGLASLQAAVGGFIESFFDAPKGFAIWMDEEGRLKHLTRNLLSPRGEVVGPLAMTRLARNGRHIEGLSEADAERVRSWLDKLRGL